MTKIILQPTPLEPLPRHLTAMLKKAVRLELPDLTDAGLNTPSGTNLYTLAWGVSYFISGDHEHALSRLEKVYELVSSTRSARALEVKEGQLALSEGAKAKTCSCGAQLFFVKTPKGGTMPVTAEGKSHFLDCPDAKKHSKGAKKPRKTAPRAA